MSIVGICGWLLDRACEIDSAHHGFVGHVFRASGERRHVIAAYLSLGAPATTFEDDGELGAFLSAAGHDEVLAAAFKELPTGYRSCLRRAGPQPYSKRHYGYLHALLSSRERPATLRLLPRLDRVTPTKLRIARVLQPELQRPTIVGALKTVEHARDLARLYHLLVEAGVDQSALLQALATVRDMADVRRLAGDWGLRVNFPPHPIPSGPGYSPISTGEELRGMAMRLRNCARTYVARIMESRSAFALVMLGEHKAVVHLMHFQEGWSLDDVYGPANGPADPELEMWALAYLGRHGVTRAPARRTDRPWACLDRLAGRYGFEVE